jgi:hypothetical protein
MRVARNKREEMRKKIKFTQLLISEIRELDKNIKKKVVKNRESAQSFVMFSLRPFKGRAKQSVFNN